MSAVIGKCPTEFANAAIEKIGQARPEDFGLSSVEFPEKKLQEELAESLHGLAIGRQPLGWRGDALCELGLIRKPRISFSDGTPSQVQYVIPYENYAQALMSLGREGLLKFINSSGTFETNAD